jgi:hypothetical protein
MTSHKTQNNCCPACRRRRAICSTTFSMIFSRDRSQTAPDRSQTAPDRSQTAQTARRAVSDRSRPLRTALGKKITKKSGLGSQIMAAGPLETARDRTKSLRQIANREHGFHGFVRL